MDEENARHKGEGFFASLFGAIKGEPGAVSRLQEWAQKFLEAQRFMDELPEILAVVLKDSAVLPHPSLGIPHLVSVLTAWEDGGAAAVVAAMLEHNRAVFADRWYRERIEERWRKSPRWPVMHDALRAHDAGYFGASVPPALAQTEGLIADATQHKGRMGGPALMDRVRELAGRDGFISGRLMLPFLQELLAQFEHGAAECPLFSRHAILHGGDYRYGSWQNSVRALTWFDVVLSVSEAAVDEVAGGPPDVGLDGHESE